VNLRKDHSHKKSFMQESAKALAEILLENKFFSHPSCALVSSEKETTRTRWSI